MENIAYGYETGFTTLEADVLTSAGATRELDIALTEVGTTGLYLGNCATMQVGDIIRFRNGDVIEDWAEYIDLQKATKVLTNKAVQNKNTGEIDYYDDDGETIILTHTPVDGESNITRLPG